mgnify:CR=1 FL=1
MPIEKTKLEFSEQDLKELIAEKYNLKLEGMYLNVSYYEGNARESSSTTIYVESIKLKNDKNIN